LIDGQQIAADLLDVPRNSVPVLRSQPIQRLQDHQPQRALQNIHFLFHVALLVPNRKRMMPHFLWESNR
jgi:hypothetical protein